MDVILSLELLLRIAWTLVEFIQAFQSVDYADEWTKYRNSEPPQLKHLLGNLWTET